MNNILDKCVYQRCPLKDTCLRFNKKLRPNQTEIFRYNNGCKNYWKEPIKKQIWN